MSAHRRRTAVLAVVLLASTLLITGCTGDGSVPSARSSSGPPTTITVLAAASLTEVFTTIGADYQQTHPGVRVRFSFGASSTLAAQVDQGAPADVFASADERTMTTVSAAGNTSGPPAIFATNVLEIAVPQGNPGRITGLRDFTDPAKKVALCAPQVPCGAAARGVFTKAGLTPKPVSYETDVKAALQKVAQDEVDAALVYRTDIRTARGRVQGIAVPAADQVVNRYPITVLKQSDHPDTAAGFVGYVRSAPGRAVLRKAGFGTP